MRANLVLALGLLAAAAACSKEGAAPPAAPAIPAAPPPVGEPTAAAPAAPSAAAPSSAPAGPAPTAAPPAAAAPSPGGPTCEELVSKTMLDAITGLSTKVSAVPEPAPAGKAVRRCEHQAADIEQHFGYYVECGKAARKAYASLRRQLGKQARGRKGPWRGGFAGPGTFAFLSEDRGCFGQVAGRLLLRRPDAGERIAAEVARSLARR